MLTGLLLTPILLHRLGQDRFAIWAFASQLIQVLLSLDGGLGPTVSRFFSISRVSGDQQATMRLLLSALTGLIIVGAFGTIIVAAAAPILAHHYLHLPPPLRSEATNLFRLVGLALILILLGNVFSGLLSANDRFFRIFVANLSGAIVYILGVVFLIHKGSSVSSLFIVVSLEAGAILVVAGVSSWDLMRPFRWKLLSATETRELAHFAITMQVSGVAIIVANNTDAFVIAGIFPARYLALYSVGASVALGLRAIPSWTLAPTNVRLSVAFGEGGVGKAVEEFRLLHPRWTTLVAIYTVIVAISAFVAVRLWLGAEYRVSAVIASLLITAFGINLATGMMSGLVRAIGRPDVETRSGVVATLTNVVLTVPLAVAFGVYGVEVATAIGISVGSLYFATLLRRSLPNHDIGPLFRNVPLGPLVLSAFATFGCEQLVLARGNRGLPGAAEAAAVAGLVLTVGVAWSERRRPTLGSPTA